MFMELDKRKLLKQDPFSFCQVLALVAHVIETGKASSPILIAAPTAVIANWEKEFARWLPELDVVACKGPATTRNSLYKSMVGSSTVTSTLAGFEYIIEEQHAVAASRKDKIHSKMLKWGLVPKVSGCEKTGRVYVVLTSHDLLLRDAAQLSRISWHYLIVDEGHRLKNASCKLAAALKGYTARHRLLLTGIVSARVFNEAPFFVSLSRSKSYMI